MKMKPLLLLHGAIGAKSQFSELEDILSKKYEVHSFNFTGHGGMEIPEETFSIELFAGDIIKYLSETKIKKANVFGYSMGGYAALNAANHFPEKFDKIFTLATKFDWSPDIAAREVKMLDAAAIRVKVPAFAEELIKRHGEENWEKVLAKTSEMMITLGRESPLDPENYSGIESEVTVSVGDRDKMVTLEETIAVYRSLKKGRLLVFPDTPHPIEGVETVRLAREITEFIM
jgi:pimeloyl-ACP methyl ester carboxylesterase